MSQLINQLN